MRPTEILAEHIREHGPIPTVRVSSARASGRARQYPYWDAVRYQICLTRDGSPMHAPLGRAVSRRRSVFLAGLDAQNLAEREGRVVLEYPRGRLTEHEAARVLGEIGHPRAREAYEWVESELAQHALAREG